MSTVHKLLYEISALIYRYFALNVLFIVCCVPIITAPAAIAGLFTVARKFVYKDEPSIAQAFFKGFRENFKQSVGVGLIMLVAALLVWGDFSLSRDDANGWLMAIFLIGLFAALSVFAHIYSLMVHMELRFIDLFLNSLKMSFIKPLLSLYSIVFILIFLYVAYIVPILFFTFFFSTSATIVYRLMNIKFDSMGISREVEFDQLT